MIKYKGKEDVFTDSRIIGLKNLHELMNAILHSLLANEVDLFMLPYIISNLVFFFFLFLFVGIIYSFRGHHLFFQDIIVLANDHYSSRATSPFKKGHL